MLFKKTGIAEGHLPPEKAAAEGIAAAISKMNYSAAGIAPRDLAAGIDFLLELQKKSSFSWLSTNITSVETGKNLFLPYILHQIGDTTIGIIGVTGPPKNLQLPKIKILPWQDVLPKIVSGVEKQADMVILLSSYPQSVNKKIAEQIDNIHLILQSGTGGSNKAPQLIKNTLLCRTGDRGKYLGWLRIDWKKSHKWGDNPAKQIKKQQNKLDRVLWQIGKLEKKVEADKLAENDRYQGLQREKEELTADIDRLKKLAAKNSPDLPGSYSNNFIGLETSMPDDPEINAIVLNTRRTVNELNRQMLKKQSTSIHKGKDNDAAAPEKHLGISTLNGWKSCRECHPEQTTFWQQTQHANAYQTLVDEEQQFKPDCLWCHITLPSYEEGSFSDNTLRMIRIKPQLQNVGCETCHGPGKKHSEKPKEVHLVFPKQKLCLTCHTEEHDDNFQFDQDVKKIGCPKQQAK